MAPQEIPRQILREEVAAAIRSAGLLGNGDRERLIRIDERQKISEDQLRSIDQKIDQANAERKHDIDQFRLEVKTDYVRKGDIQDVAGDFRKARWMLLAGVVTAVLAVALSGKAGG